MESDLRANHPVSSCFHTSTLLASLHILQRFEMRWAILYILLAPVVVTLAKMPVAEYRDLPTLREQDALEKGWVQKRYDFIPTVLEK